MIKLSVPAIPESVRVVRLTAASVAAGLDLPYDAVDDLRIAVGEACARLLALENPGTTLEVEITGDDRRIEILTTSDGAFDGWPDEPRERFAERILSALANDVRFERVEGRPAIRLSKRAGGDRP